MWVCVKQEGCLMFFFFLAIVLRAAVWKELKQRKWALLIHCKDLSVCILRLWPQSFTAEEVNGKVSVRCANTWLILSAYCFILTLSIREQGRTSNGSTVTLLFSSHSNWQKCAVFTELFLGRLAIVCIPRWVSVCTCVSVHAEINSSAGDLLFSLRGRTASACAAVSFQKMWGPSEKCQRGLNDKAAARSPQKSHPQLTANSLEIQ